MLPRNKHFRSAAFTLVELVLVLVICALLAALIYPAVRSSWATFSARSSADDFVRLLRQARLYCTQTQQPCEVRFIKTSDGAYDTEVYLFDEAGNSRKITSAWADTVADVSIASAGGSYTQQTDPPAIRFYPAGVREPVTLTLRENRDAKKIITISSPSGIISAIPADAARINTVANYSDQAKLFWNEQCMKTITQ